MSDKHVEKYVQELIDKGHPIRIVSGEGEIGHVEPYTGKRTIRAIKLRLARERRGGDRWARASVYSHDVDVEDEAWVDVETGSYW
jgi:hypothetical protein